MKKSKKKFIFFIIGLLLLVASGFLVFNIFQQSVLEFEEDYLPYGESINQITDLELINTFQNTDPNAIAYSIMDYDSKYWEIKQILRSNCFLRDYGCVPIAEQRFGGSDLNLISSTPVSNKLSQFTLVSTEDFSERTFKAKFNPQFIPQIAPTSGLDSSMDILLTGDSGEVLVANHRFGYPGVDMNLIVSPSVVNDNVNIYINGEKTKSVSYQGKYKIKIIIYGLCENTCPRVIMEEPSYKSQFGCTTEPGEQTYVRIYNEGMTVNLEDFNNFRKFCLDISPLKVYTPSGIGVDREVLGSLIEGESFIVPTGQIWSFEYIGEKSLFQTTCEEGLVYYENDNSCTARTVVTFQCPLDSINPETGVCEISTEPVTYTQSSIRTHQELQDVSKFRFTHIVQDEKTTTSPSINIGYSSFNSLGVNYIGNEVGTISYPEDKSNWKTKFSYNGVNYDISLGQTIQLDDYLSVELTDIGGYKDKNNLITDYKAEYTFSINVDFLTLSYKDRILIVNNNYQTFEGGIVLTTTNVLGTTKVEKIEETLFPGNNEFPIETTTLEEFKVRPFIKISTPIFTYNIDGKYALVNDISLLEEQAKEIENLKLTIEQKAAYIKELQLTLQEEINLINQLELTISEKASIIQDLQSEISSQAEMINSLSKNLEDKILLVSQLQVENEKQAELISEMELSFKEQADIISGLNKEIEDDAVIIDGLNLSLDEEAELIARLNLKIEEDEELVKLLKSNISEQEELLQKIKEEKQKIKLVLIVVIALSLSILIILFLIIRKTILLKRRRR